MFHVKRMAATALAALMIAGAVPALASADASDTETSAAQEETVVESGKKAHKKRAASGDSGDTADTDAARARRKPSKSADSEEPASEKPAKPAKKSQNAETSGTESAKPAKKMVL